MVAVMWSTSADAHTIDEIDINHLDSVSQSVYEEPHNASQPSPSSHVPLPITSVSYVYLYINCGKSRWKGVFILPCKMTNVGFAVDIH